MSNKFFIFLVVVLTILIIISSVLLVMSIAKYHTTTNLKDGKPSVLVDKPVVNKESEKPANNAEKDTKKEEEQDTTVSDKKDNNKDNSSNKDYILPSDAREILSTEIQNMDCETLNKAYNEIFARHGHDFKTESLKEYFTSKSWYKPVSGKTVDVSELSSIEAKNLSLIKARIDELK